MPPKTVLVWFRRTLRLDDNEALCTALADSALVVPVFVLDPTILSRPDTGARRVAFLYDGLHALDAALRERGSYLVLRHGDPAEELGRLAEETGATALYYSQEYEPAGQARDARVCNALRLESNACLDHLLSEPESVKTKTGTPYTVFTPYFRVWQEQAFAVPRSTPERIPTPPGIATEPLPTGSAAFPAGELAALAQLTRLGTPRFHTTTRAESSLRSQARRSSPRT